MEAVESRVSVGESQHEKEKESDNVVARRAGEMCISTARSRSKPLMFNPPPLTQHQRCHWENRKTHRQEKEERETLRVSHLPAKMRLRRMTTTGGSHKGEAASRSHPSSPRAPYTAAHGTPAAAVTATAAHRRLSALLLRMVGQRERRFPAHLGSLSFLFLFATDGGLCRNGQASFTLLKGETGPRFLKRGGKTTHKKKATMEGVMGAEQEAIVSVEAEKIRCSDRTER